MKLTKTKAYYRMKTWTSILMSIFCNFSIHPRGVYVAATFSHYHIVYIIYFLKLFTSFHSFFFSHLYQVDIQKIIQTPPDWYLYQAGFQIFFTNTTRLVLIPIWNRNLSGTHPPLPGSQYQIGSPPCNRVKN